MRSGVDGELYRHRFETPVGAVEEVRRWSEMTFSWPIVHHMVQNVDDLKVIRYIFEHISYSSRWDVFEEVDRLVGESGCRWCRFLTPAWVFSSAATRAWSER